MRTYFLPSFNTCFSLTKISVIVSTVVMPTPCWWRRKSMLRLAVIVFSPTVISSRSLNLVCQVTCVCVCVCACVCVYVHLLSHVRLFVTPWTVARQAPLSMGFFSQEYWSELPFPSPRDLPHPGMESTSPALAGGFFTTEPPGKSRSHSQLEDRSQIWPQASWLQNYTLIYYITVSTPTHLQRN